MHPNIQFPFIFVKFLSFLCRTASNHSANHLHLVWHRYLLPVIWFKTINSQTFIHAQRLVVYWHGFMRLIKWRRTVCFNKSSKMQTVKQSTNIQFSYMNKYIKQYSTLELSTYMHIGENFQHIACMYLVWIYPLVTNAAAFYGVWIENACKHFLWKIIYSQQHFTERKNCGKIYFRKSVFFFRAMLMKRSGWNWENINLNGNICILYLFHVNF